MTGAVDPEEVPTLCSAMLLGPEDTVSIPNTPQPLSCVYLQCSLPLPPAMLSPGPEDTVTIPITDDPFFTFHHVNAFEAGPGGRQLVLDTCAMPRVDFSRSTDNIDASYYGDMANATQMCRLVVDIDSGKVGAGGGGAVMAWYGVFQL